MIAYRTENTTQTLILSDEVLAHFGHHRQLGATDEEAGGQLFARLTQDQIIIMTATGPRRSDRRSRFSFIPDRRAERQEIERLFKLGLHYVGDWHTHPELLPHPSAIDIRNLNETFRKSKHQLAGFVMIIVGTCASPNGLYVGIANGNTLVPCTPIALARPLKNECQHD